MFFNPGKETLGWDTWRSLKIDVAVLIVALALPLLDVLIEFLQEIVIGQLDLVFTGNQYGLF